MKGLNSMEKAIRLGWMTPQPDHIAPRRWMMGYFEDSPGSGRRSQKEAVDTTARRPAGVERPQGQETILLVEDEEFVRALARQVLQQSGYTVLEARHGDEALEISRQYHGPIHLMVTDVAMPQMSGIELAKRFASVRPEMKVLFMSGHPERALTDRGELELGAPYIGKPFALTALTGKVRELLDAKRNRNEGAAADPPMANRCSSTTAR
jgi:response regulator RpfG family c-di-GMP phosphodiesterase